MTSPRRARRGVVPGLAALVAAGCARSLAPVDAVDPVGAFDAPAQDPAVDAAPDVAADRASDAGANADAAVDATSLPPSPRPIAPLSTARVTSRRPTLRWQLAPGTDGARVELCHDRACTAILASFDASGPAGAPAADLPPGVVFWRVRAPAGGSSGATVSPTWQFTVGARSAPVDTSWGSTPDVNGDGYADVLMGASNAGLGEGAAFVYPGGPTFLTADFPAYITLAAPAGGNFGISMASAGDVDGDGYADVVVGAPTAANGPGAAYVYRGGPTGLSAGPAFSLTGPDGGRFGISVAGAGDINGDGYADVVVGANDAFEGMGAAYVYLGSASGLSTTPVATLSGTVPAGSFGISVAGAGDINGDGYADLVIGALAAMRGNVYLGGPSGPTATPTPSFPSYAPSVAGAGDVNGDGYADVIVRSENAAHSGIVSVYLGGASGLSSTPASTGLGDMFARVDGPCASLGDINGDGYADVAVGSPDGYDNRGAAFIAGGNGSGGLGWSGPILFENYMDQAHFGSAVVGVGDVDGDGYDDTVIGANGAFGGAGVAYLYHGGTGDTFGRRAVTFFAPVGGGSFGSCVANAAGVRQRLRERCSAGSRPGSRAS